MATTQATNKASGMGSAKRKRRSPSLYIPPEFVSWLSNNYVVNTEESVPKDSIYRRYVQHCREMEVVPKKSNIFGKMLKKMFPNIRPRRLGSAGNMVAHYAGITLRQPGRPLMSTPGNSPRPGRHAFPRHHPHHHRAASASAASTGSSSSAGAISSPQAFSLPPSPAVGHNIPSSADEDFDDDVDDEDLDSSFSQGSPGYTSFSSGPNSPTSVSSPSISSSSAVPSTTPSSSSYHSLHGNNISQYQPASMSSPSSDSSSPFAANPYYYNSPQTNAQNFYAMNPSVPTFGYSSPNHQSFLSSLSSGLQPGDNGDLLSFPTECCLVEGAAGAQGEDLYQVRTRTFEEQEMIEEEEADDDDHGMSYLLENYNLDGSSPPASSASTSSTSSSGGAATSTSTTTTTTTTTTAASLGGLFAQDGDDFAHLILNEKEQQKESPSTDKDHNIDNTDNLMRDVDDLSMLDSCLNDDVVGMSLSVDSQDQAKTTAGGVSEQATTATSNTETTTAQPAPTATIMATTFTVNPNEVIESSNIKSGDGNAGPVPPCMRDGSQQHRTQRTHPHAVKKQLHQQQQLQHEFMGLSVNDPQLGKVSELKKYMCIFARQIWMYAPISTKVLDENNPEYYILTEEGKKEHTVRSLCVKFALYMGALYCENFSEAKDLYMATRDTLSSVFDILDLDVALVLLHLSYTAHNWYEKEEADALAFNYISAALSLCQAAKAINSDVYRRCVEYEGWLALRTGPAGQPPLRPYHPPPACYKVVGRPTPQSFNASNTSIAVAPPPPDPQLVIDDTISILANVMNTLRFYEAYSANAPSMQSNSPRVTRRTSWNAKQQGGGDRPLCSPEEAEAKLGRLKENFKILQKQLEMCYNLICQVEASGGFSFEAAFRPKFWLISIVSPVHLIMGEKEKGLNASLLAVKSIEKWLSLSGSLWGCGVMFDYVADSLDKVNDDSHLEQFVSLIEKQKYCESKATQAFANKWRQRLNEKKSK